MCVCVCVKNQERKSLALGQFVSESQRMDLNEAFEAIPRASTPDNQPKSCYPLIHNLFIGKTPAKVSNSITLWQFYTVNVLYIDSIISTGTDGMGGKPSVNNVMCQPVSQCWLPGWNFCSLVFFVGGGRGRFSFTWFTHSTFARFPG